MTKEEAIEIVKEFPTCLQDQIDNNGYGDARFDIEQAKRDIIALNMAIEALSVEPCDDAISRQATITAIKDYFHDEYYQRTSIQDCRDNFIEDVLTKLPSVQPKQRIGHWIEHEHKGLSYLQCSECGDWFLRVNVLPGGYCNNCGTRMVWQQESEDKE